MKIRDLREYDEHNRVGMEYTIIANNDDITIVAPETVKVAKELSVGTIWDMDDHNMFTNNRGKEENVVMLIKSTGEKFFVNFEKHFMVDANGNKLPIDTIEELMHDHPDFWRLMLRNKMNLEDFA